MKAALTSSLMSLSLRIGPTATFDIEKFLSNSTSKLKLWGGLLLILIGVIMMIVAVVKVASGLISHGKKQVSWVVCIIMFILGGALCSFAAGDAAWSWVQGIAEGGKQTIDDLGGGSGGGGGGGGVTPTIIHWLR